MHSFLPAILCGALLTMAALPGATARAGMLGLCELREEDGLQCECRDSEANCEVTRPLVAFVPVAHRSHQPPVEAAKRRRDARTINTLVLHSPRNESFLDKFPADVFQEPLQFKSISMAYASLGKLTSYAISGSRFLRELTLSACGISALLQNAISGFENLQRIDLSHNQIAHIPVGALKNLPALKQLIIVRSEVEDIEPHAFVELRSLEKLSLKDNYLTEIDNLLFTGLEKLQEVELNFNYIQKLGDDTFMDLPNLRRVDLTGNRLTVVTDKTFRGMRSLTYLSLYYNNFKHLPTAFLKDSPDLKELNLERNRLESVTLDNLRGLRAIRSDFVLKLKSNPLNCSCDLFYLTELRKRRMGGSENDLQDPPEFENLQCRQRMSDHLEPRSFDEIFAVKECQDDPSLSEHIVDLAVVAGAHAVPQPSRTLMALSQMSIAFASCLIARRLL